MSSVTRTARIVMTDRECLEEALDSSSCTGWIRQGRDLIVDAAGESIRLTDANSNRRWSYSYHKSLTTQMKGFDTWFKGLQKLYEGVIEEKEARIRAEEKRQAELSKEMDKLRGESEQAKVQLDGESENRLKEIELELEKSKYSLDEAKRRLDSVEKSRISYVRKTEDEIKERGVKGGWKLARDVHDSSRRVSMIRLERRRVSN